MNMFPTSQQDVVSKTVILKIIKADNSQRQSQAKEIPVPVAAVGEDEEADLSRFDLDPRDELTSYEEEA